VKAKITDSNLRGLMMRGDPSTGPAGPVLDLRIDAGGPGDWMISNQTLDAQGTVQETLPSWIGGCLPKPPPGAVKGPAPVQRPDVAPCFARLADLGYRQRVTYQPAANFWALQWRETGVLLAATLLLTGFCFWRIRRDLS
jgi:hypothetical protein